MKNLEFSRVPIPGDAVGMTIETPLGFSITSGPPPYIDLKRFQMSGETLRWSELERRIWTGEPTGSPLPIRRV